MTENRKPMPPDFNDDAPDLSTPEWQAKFDKAKVMRGAQVTPRKVPVSIRLSAEVVEHFKAQGKGWQSRIDEALKAVIAQR